MEPANKVPSDAKKVPLLSSMIPTDRVYYRVYDRIARIIESV